MKKNKGYLILSLILILTLAPANVCRANSIRDIKKKFNQDCVASAEQKNKYDIERMYQDRIKGYSWDHGEGVRSVLAITVQFKVREKDKDLSIPHMCVYFFDREKAQVEKIEQFFYKTPTGSRPGYEADTYVGFKTYQIQFPYTISDKYQYAVAVIGDNQECSAEILPRSAVLKDFDFAERYLVK